MFAQCKQEFRSKLCLKALSRNLLFLGQEEWAFLFCNSFPTRYFPYAKDEIHVSAQCQSGSQLSERTISCPFTMFSAGLPETWACQSVLKKFPLSDFRQKIWMCRIISEELFSIQMKILIFKSIAFSSRILQNVCVEWENRFSPTRGLD